MRNPLPALAVATVVGLIGWMILTSGGEERRLDASVMGSDGLAIWLRSNGIETSRSSKRITPQHGDYAVAILPLYDTDLGRESDSPRDDAERMTQTDLRDAPNWVVETMAESLPTLIVLPKWRGGFALTGIAHEQTQIPPPPLDRLIRQTGLRGAALRPVENRVTTARLAPFPAGTTAETIALFRAQLIDRATLPPACSMLAGIDQGALLIECRKSDNFPAAFYLTDPDLLNNHGLALADNAAFALSLLRGLRGGDARPVLLAAQPVYIADYDAAREPHERTAEDLARFFAWPLSALWAMGGVVLGLTVWRGMRRFGPARGPAADRTASSRRAAIAAKARLLRLSGADARMAAEHARAHLADLAVQALGPGAGNDAGIARWLALVARRDAALAEALQLALAAITPDTAAADLPQRLALLHDLTRKAQDAA